MLKKMRTKKEVEEMDKDNLYYVAVIGSNQRICTGAIKDEVIRRYDGNIASEGLWNRMIDGYQNSEKSLRQLSNDLEKEYGMHVASSTISKHARRALGVKSRVEAKGN